MRVYGAGLLSSIGELRVIFSISLFIPPLEKLEVYTDYVIRPFVRPPPFLNRNTS